MPVKLLMPDPSNNERFHFYGKLALGYYLPITLIWMGIIPFAWRYPALIVVFLAMLLYVGRQKRTAHQLGFRRDTLRDSLFLNAIVTGIGLAVLLALVKAGFIHPRNPWEMGWFYPFYVFFSSPVQEFLFRSLIVTEMRAAGIRSVREITLVSAATFAFVHVVYGHPLTTLATFLIGLAWGAIYARCPNWWGVTLSHIILGAAAIISGLII